MALSAWLAVTCEHGDVFGVGVCVAVFYLASSFNGDLSSWNTSSVTRMNSSTCMGVAEACFVLRSRLAVMADARALTMLAYVVERLVGSQV